MVFVLLDAEAMRTVPQMKYVSASNVSILVSRREHVDPMHSAKL